MWRFSFCLRAHLPLHCMHASIYRRRGRRSRVRIKEKKKMFMDYPEEPYYFLRAYPTNEVIWVTDAALMQYTRPPSMLATQYAEVLVTKSFRYGKIYNEYVLKGVFIGGHYESIRHSMQIY